MERGGRVRVKLVGRGKIEDGMGWWSEEGRMEWGDAGGRGMCKKSRQAVGTVPGSCQLSALLRINTPVIL